jgi:hypothetical protein
LRGGFSGGRLLEIALKLREGGRVKKRVEVVRGVIVEADCGCFRVLLLRKSLVHLERL